MTTEHEKCQAAATARAGKTFETDVVRYLLTSFGRLDLMGDLLFYEKYPEPFARLEDLWDHERIAGVLPMKFEAWYRPYQRVEPNFRGLLEQLRVKRPDSAFAELLNPNWDPDELGDLAVGLVVTYRSDVMVIHNWPGFSHGKPIRNATLPNGCRIAMHRAWPFLMDYADEYRMLLADEGSELYDRIESNDDFDIDGEGAWEADELRCEDAHNDFV